MLYKWLLNRVAIVVYYPQTYQSSECAIPLSSVCYIFMDFLLIVKYY